MKSMYISIDQSKLSLAEACLFESVSDRMTLRQLAQKLNMSVMATWARIQPLIQKGSAQVIYE